MPFKESWSRGHKFSCCMYMPSVTALRAGDKLQSKDVTSENKPEKVTLQLPSKLPPSTPCDPQLWQIEWELHHVQANDTLNDVQWAIQVYAHISIFKRLNVWGQWGNTQACGALDHAEKKKQRAKFRYTAAREHFQALTPGSTRLARTTFFNLCRMLTWGIWWICWMARWKAPKICLGSGRCCYGSVHLTSF